jgi:hypothetical protein
MGKNLLHSGNSIITCLNPVCQQKVEIKRPDPWVSDFAKRMLDSNTGLVFASPFFICKFHSDVFERHNQKLAELFWSLDGANALFAMHGPREMFRAQSLLGSQQVHGIFLPKCIGMAGEGEDHGKYSAGFAYHKETAAFVEAFTRQFSSFSIVGTRDMSIRAFSALYDYLQANGIDKKNISLEKSFIYVEHDCHRTRPRPPV